MPRSKSHPPAPSASSNSLVRGQRPAMRDDQAGEVVVTDLRKGGWSWAWDTLAREFAGILRQVGVGIYFTYASYTDNRKDSPYRGSSYTGVEALAEFSGESADDIRTVNKLLATLNLARFETYTVYMYGKDGRRATRNRLHCYLVDRDPHLSLDDVLAVLRLASTDQRVYKHIRHIFRPGFHPIDRAESADGTPRENVNPWYQILPVVQASAEWQDLARRAEQDLVSLRKRNVHGVTAAAARRRTEQSERNASTILRSSDDAVHTTLPITEDATKLRNTDEKDSTIPPKTEAGSLGIIPVTEGNHDQAWLNNDQYLNTLAKRLNKTSLAGSFEALAVRRAADEDPSLIRDQLMAICQLATEVKGAPLSSEEERSLARCVADFATIGKGGVPRASDADQVIAGIAEAIGADDQSVLRARLQAMWEEWKRIGSKGTDDDVLHGKAAGETGLLTERSNDAPGGTTRYPSVANAAPSPAPNGPLPESGHHQIVPSKGLRVLPNAVSDRAGRREGAGERRDVSSRHARRSTDGEGQVSGGRGVPSQQLALRSLVPSTLVNEALGYTNHVIWSHVLADVRRILSPLRADLLEAQTALVGWEDGYLLIAASSRFAADEITRCGAEVLRALRSMVGDPNVEVRCIVWAE